MPAFGASAPSNRDLAIVKLRGSSSYAVRDVTDVYHSTSLATLDAAHGYQYILYRFAGPTDVSYELGDACSYLFRMNFVTHASAQVAVPGTGLYDWSPDGTTLTYVTWQGRESDLRQIAGGVVKVLGPMPALPAAGCESLACADRSQFELSYSPDGRYFFVAESPFNPLRIYSGTGSLLYTSAANSGATMAAWSGDDLYFEDASGIEAWHAGSIAIVLKGASWIGPTGSPAAGAVLFTVREPSGLPRVRLLDTATRSVRDVASGADSPHFLTARYAWYEGIRPCGAADSCPLAPVTQTGKAYVYDLQTGTAMESDIADVFDTWPRAA